MSTGGTTYRQGVVRPVHGAPVHPCARPRPATSRPGRARHGGCAWRQAGTGAGVARTPQVASLQPSRQRLATGTFVEVDREKRPRVWSSTALHEGDCLTFVLEKVVFNFCYLVQELLH